MNKPEENATVVDLNEIISKSLDEMDALATMVDTVNAENLAKSIPAGEVSKDAPPPEEESSEEGNSEEDGEQEGDPEAEEEDRDREAEEEGTEEQDEEEGSQEEEYEKSLTNELSGNENVRKALEVSEFLSELVKSLSSVIDNHTSTLAKSVKATEDTTVLLAKSMTGIAKSQQMVVKTQGTLQKSLDSIVDRLNTLERQPAMKKSMSNTAQANKAKVEVLEKSFDGAPADKKDTLTKSEALVKLNAAFEGGNTSVVNDILSLESTGSFDALSASGRTLLGL